MLPLVMEKAGLPWTENAVAMVNANLPFLKEIAQKVLTQRF
jgi:hypothetical protein